MKNLGNKFHGIDSGKLLLTPEGGEGGHPIPPHSELDSFAGGGGGGLFPRNPLISHPTTLRQGGSTDLKKKLRLWGGMRWGTSNAKTSVRGKYSLLNSIFNIQNTT